MPLNDPCDRALPQRVTEEDEQRDEEPRDEYELTERLHSFVIRARILSYSFLDNLTFSVSGPFVLKYRNELLRSLSQARASLVSVSVG